MSSEENCEWKMVDCWLTEMSANTLVNALARSDSLLIPENALTNENVCFINAGVNLSSCNVVL